MCIKNNIDFFGVVLVVNVWYSHSSLTIAAWLYGCRVVCMMYSVASQYEVWPWGRVDLRLSAADIGVSYWWESQSRGSASRDWYGRKHRSQTQANVIQSRRSSYSQLPQRSTSPRRWSQVFQQASTDETRKSLWRQYVHSTHCSSWFCVWFQQAKHPNPEASQQPQRLFTPAVSQH